MSRRIIGPFNRVEGDLEVQIEIDEGRISEAWVVSPLYRGFEQILQGKDPLDALVYVPRICGICSVSQSVAAAQALADVQGLALPPNGERASNLILANENVADHLTHFYLLFMPDFAREIYRNEAWFPAAEGRFKAIKGSAARQVLSARADFMHLMGLLAGKWPHSLALQPGGTSRAIEVQEKARIIAHLSAFRQFLEQVLFGDSLENIIALDSADALHNWTQQAAPASSDLRHFLHIAEALELQNLGRATDQFMSYGVYPEPGGRLFTAGTWNGEAGILDQTGIREDISHGWMHHQNEAKHPFDGVTLPSIDAPDAYSWCKAPRLDGQVMEVGALARQVVNGHPLIRDLVRQSGGNVRNRVVARLLEIALVVIAMEGWARALQPKEAFCQHGKMPDEAQGYGMIEAARGSLGHWLSISKGRILNYQIIAPTTWNFSPRDAEGVPGALEQALIGAPVRNGEKEPVAVQHIVRSFDPCMACTVH
ncbi:Hydrogen-sensing hydrogenase large subunit (HoxC/HupV) [hydrothermal vent metagenome]|uniref:Hydrogen-sensing hydrogenase large subunit (HoxC/HupV) n=1 Tax=hydrothermal vent metagenome TaxID=652676 RepID=A0A3B1BMN8_9ZZZZ